MGEKTKGRNGRSRKAEEEGQMKKRTAGAVQGHVGRMAQRSSSIPHSSKPPARARHSSSSKGFSKSN